MANVVTTGLYEFDPKGINPKNLIPNEVQTLQTPGADDFYFFIPHAAPFFVDDFALTNKATGALLKEGEDYVLGHQFVEAQKSIGRPMYGSVRLLKRTITGQVGIKYRTIGGNWGFNDRAILAELASKQYNPLVRAWGMIDVLPATFPPLEHDQSLDTLTGSKQLLAGIEELADILEATAAGASANHLADFNNPHKVTKKQVGLEFVQNYGIASDDEMRQGTAADRYATPRGVKLAISEQALKPLQSHLDDKENPHDVTKKQIGLEFTPNMPVATREQAIDITNNSVLLTPYTAAVLLSAQSDGGRIDKLEQDLQKHLLDFDNPHDVTPAQIGTLTEAQIRELLTDVSATDTPRFAGQTEEEWRASLPAFADFKTMLETWGTYYQDEANKAGQVKAEDPVTNQDIQAKELLKPSALIAGWDGYGVGDGMLKFTITQAAGLKDMPVSIGTGWDKFVIRENARYWVLPDGSIGSAGSAAIAPPLGYRAGVSYDGTKPTAHVFASKAGNYALMESGALMKWVDSNTMTQVIASDVVALMLQVNAAAGLEKMIYEDDDAVFKPLGNASWVSAINTLFTAWAGTTTRNVISDVQLGNDYAVFLFESGEVAIYKINVAGTTVTLASQALPAGWPATFTQISGAYDHFGLLGSDGEAYFFGDNSAGQQEVNRKLGPLKSLACGKDFTLTLGTNRQVMFWGDSPDNSLLPVNV